MGLKSKPLSQVRADVPVADVSREDLARINLNVPVSVRKAWKEAALRDDKTLSELIIESMSKYSETQILK
jgi:hypothetical protein